MAEPYQICYRAGGGWYDIPGSGRVNDGPVEVYSYLWEYIHGVGSWICGRRSTIITSGHRC